MFPGIHFHSSDIDDWTTFLFLLQLCRASCIQSSRVFFPVFSAYTAVQDVRKKKQIIIEKIVKEEKNKSSNSSYVLRLHCMRGNWFCFSEEIGKDFYIIFIGEGKVDLLAGSR